MTNGAIFHKAQENVQNNSTNQQSVYNCQGGSSHRKLLLLSILVKIIFSTLSRPKKIDNRQKNGFFRKIVPIFIQFDISPKICTRTNLSIVFIFIQYNKKGWKLQPLFFTVIYPAFPSNMPQVLLLPLRPWGHLP